MTRGELVAVTTKMIRTHRLDRFSPRELAVAILDEVEPMIREDERKRAAERVRIPRDVATDEPDPWVPLTDVLALIEQGPR